MVQSFLRLYIGCLLLILQCIVKPYRPGEMQLAEVVVLSSHALGWHPVPSPVTGRGTAQFMLVYHL